MAARENECSKPKSCDKRLNFQEGRFNVNCGHKKRDDNGGSLFEHVAEFFEKVSRRKKKFRWMDKPLSLFLGNQRSFCSIFSIKRLFRVGRVCLPVFMNLSFGFQVFFLSVSTQR